MFSKFNPFKWFKREESRGYKLLTDDDLIEMIMSEDHTDPYLFKVKAVGEGKFAVVSRFFSNGDYTPNQWNFVTNKSAGGNYATFARDLDYISETLTDSRIQALTRMKNYRKHVLETLQKRIKNKEIRKNLEEIKNEP
ncbi:hypothetical protein [Vibrio phage VCPH]|nr:hypothetical protein [Vibrio phage VCPH]